MTTRHKLFATWKNRVSPTQSLTLARAAVQATVRTEGLFELSVSPSMTALASVAQATVNKLAITAQNMGWDDTHSLTGETSASDLTDIGCRYVILGHCERRLYLGETNDMIARKLQTAFTHQLTPILCVGDTLEQHHAGRFEAPIGRSWRYCCASITGPAARFSSPTSRPGRSALATNLGNANQTKRETGIASSALSSPPNSVKASRPTRPCSTAAASPPATPTPISPAPISTAAWSAPQAKS